MKNRKYKYDADHGRPLTRRDFLAQGLASGFAISMIPSVLLAMLKTELAEAQIVCPSSTPTQGLLPFVVLDLAGGAGLPSNFIVGKTGGAMDFLTSYGTLGIDSGYHPGSVSNQIDSRFGAPMHSVLSKLFEGLTQTASAAAQANTRILTICHTSQDDSRSNPLSPLLLVAKAGLLGTVLPSGVGTVRGNPVAGNSTSPIFDDALKAFPIGNGADLTHALSMGASLSSLSLSQKSKIAQAASSLSQGQLAKFQNMNQGSQFQSLAQCGYTKNVDLILNSTVVNAAANANVDLVYGNEKTGAAAAAVYNALMGNTGPASIVKPGNDYHGQGRTVSDAKDRETGVELGRVIELAHRLGKGVVVAGITDGGIAYDPAREPRSDAGVRGLSFLACYKPSGPHPLVKSQIGAYTNGQGADTSFFFAENPAHVAYILFANYLKICGQLNRFSTIVAPGAFPIAELNNIIGFG